MYPSTQKALLNFPHFLQLLSPNRRMTWALLSLCILLMKWNVLSFFQTATHISICHFNTTQPLEMRRYFIPLWSRRISSSLRTIRILTRVLGNSILLIRGSKCIISHKRILQNGKGGELFALLLR